MVGEEKGKYKMKRLFAFVMLMMVMISGWSNGYIIEKAQQVQATAQQQQEIETRVTELEQQLAEMEVVLSEQQEEGNGTGTLNLVEVSQLLTAIFAFLSLIVLAVSAYFLYGQIRQLDKSIRGYTYQTLIYGSFDISRTLIDRPELAEVWGDVDYVGARGEPEEVQKNWVRIMLVDHWENIFYQHEQGCMTPEMWKRWEAHIGNSFQNADVQEHWSKLRRVFYAPFREWVDSVIEEQKLNTQQDETNQRG